jgi:uncharacterized lipoprotein YbaY
MSRPASIAAILVAVTCPFSSAPTLAAAEHPLAGTSWQLVQFRGGDDTLLTPDDRSQYTLEFAADGYVAARLDCNRGRGTWTSSGANGLTLGPLALTRAMCPPGSLHDRVVKDWSYVRSYLIKDGHLFLSLIADGGIYEFEPPPVVKGMVSFRERIALPPEAVLEVVLEDVSKADAPAETIGRSLKEHPGHPPIPFAIPYDPSRIDPGHRYSVRARITVGDQVWFTTDRHYPVLTGGNAHQVALLLRPTGDEGAAGGGGTASGAAAAPFEETDWRLVSLGEPPVTVPPTVREAHVTFDPESRRLSGSGGCNRMAGSYSR